jgi:hypothetical protein
VTYQLDFDSLQVATTTVNTKALSLPPFFNEMTFVKIFQGSHDVGEPLFFSHWFWVGIRGGAVD